MDKHLFPSQVPLLGLLLKISLAQGPSFPLLLTLPSPSLFTTCSAFAQPSPEHAPWVNSLSHQLVDGDFN